MPVCSWGCAAERVVEGWHGGLGTMYISTLSSQGVQVATATAHVPIKEFYEVGQTERTNSV